MSHFDTRYCHELPISWRSKQRSLSMALRTSVVEHDKEGISHVTTAGADVLAHAVFCATTGVDPDREYMHRAFLCPLGRHIPSGTASRMQSPSATHSAVPCFGK